MGFFDFCVLSSKKVIVEEITRPMESLHAARKHHRESFGPVLSNVQMALIREPCAIGDVVCF